ncbi:hypothetical protein ABIB87_006695 [Bradyrhizobium sp. JR18.2]|jgi:hypothetical protein|nr:hypothetical protein [Bradyrhizobium barranii]
MLRLRPVEFAQAEMELQDVGDVFGDLVASVVTADDEVFGSDWMRAPLDAALSDASGSV